MKVERFEDLKVWQEARVLVSEVYQAARENGDLRKDYRFRDQITGAAVSVMSNIAEGFSRRSTREFTQFLFIAKGSCAEVQSLLYVGLDQTYLTKDRFDTSYRRADYVARLLSRLITYLLNRTDSIQNGQSTQRTKPPNESKKLRPSINATNPKNSINSKNPTNASEVS